MERMKPAEFLKLGAFAVVFLIVIAVLLEGPGGSGSALSEADRQLREAVATGNLTQARAAIASGADVNYRDGLGQSPLHSVAWAGNRAMAELLLDAGARADLRDRNFGATPLHSATRGNNPEMVRLLLAAGARPDIRTHSAIEQCASGFVYPADSTAADMARIARHRDVEALFRP